MSVRDSMVMKLAYALKGAYNVRPKQQGQIMLLSDADDSVV